MDARACGTTAGMSDQTRRNRFIALVAFVVVSWLVRPHALSPEWIRKQGLPLKDEDMDAMSCLLNVTTVAGYQVGFIGNEAYRR